jgi:catechol 2,3-dioxygenase-like lactoylglutathione lyase family enzyme
MPNDVVPEFAVRDFERSLSFYCAVLGFAIAYERPEEGFAYLRYEGLGLMIDHIGQGRSFDDGHLPRNYPSGRGVNIQLRVSQIAPLLQRLQKADYPLYLAPEDRWYRRDDLELGNRQFVVADPDGYLLRFYEDLGLRPI